MKTSQRMEREIARMSRKGVGIEALSAAMWLQIFLPEVEHLEMRSRIRELNKIADALGLPDDVKIGKVAEACVARIKENEKLKHPDTKLWCEINDAVVEEQFDPDTNNKIYAVTQSVEPEAGGYQIFTNWNDSREDLEVECRGLIQLMVLQREKAESERDSARDWARRWKAYASRLWDEKWEEAVTAYQYATECGDKDELIDRQATELSRLREALETLRDYPVVGHFPEPVMKMRRIARRALDRE